MPSSLCRVNPRSELGTYLEKNWRILGALRDIIARFTGGIISGVRTFTGSGLLSCTIRWQGLANGTDSDHNSATTKPYSVY